VLEPGDLGWLSRLRAFKNVLTSEDCIALPQFQVVRRLIEQGAIGELRKIWLFHSGYRYHAIASLRSLVSRQHVLQYRTLRYATNQSEVSLRFPNGVEATILEPYAFDGMGTFMVAGTTGIIADYPLGHPKAKHLGFSMEKNAEARPNPEARSQAGDMYRGQRLVGMTVDGELYPGFGFPGSRGDALDQQFRDALPYSLMADTSCKNLLKIRGLMQLFVGATSPQGEGGRQIDASGENHLDFQYPVVDGLYDALLTKYLMPRFSRFSDPFAPMNTSVLKLLLRPPLTQLFRLKD
jgi:hypothetical protein